MTDNKANIFDIKVSVLKDRFSLRAEFCGSAAAVAVVGPSGSGKSTLLRILAGLERAAQGQVQVAGQRWLDSDAGIFVPPWKRGVGYVAQESLLIPTMSVRENLGFSGATSPEVERIAEIFELRDLLARRPRMLSGGEKQRVALGRALLANPTLLLLDEPFSALDRRLRGHLTEQLMAQCKERHLPMILISHDERDVESLAQVVLVIENGELRTH